MNCRTCDYRLWNLIERRCPECGQPFLPSEYDFVPNSVEFCCPHCEQPYYGTDEHGHLQPKEFACVTCGRPLHMDQMVIRPAPGVQEEATCPKPFPWLERKKIGLVRAWLRTVKLSLFNPGDMMKLFPPQTENHHVRRFAAWTIFATWLPTVLLCVGYMGLFFWLLPIPGRIGGMALAGPLCVFAIGGFLAWCGVFLWGVVAHWLLRLSGPCPYPRARTMQAICLSSGALAVALIPCCGSTAAAAWWAVSAMLAVKEAQLTSWPRAILAGIAPPALCVAIVAALQFGMMSYSTSKFTTTALTWPPTSLPAPAINLQKAQISRLVQGLQRYSDDHGGQKPPHALLLIPAKSINLDDLLNDTDLLNTVTVDILEPDADRPRPMSLREFTQSDADQQKEKAAWAAAALPKPGDPHRVGEFVFTYGGVDLFAPPPGVWLVIRKLDVPSVSYTPPDEIPAFLVGHGNGQVEEITAADFPERLKKQNQFRRERGLPTIPHPALVQPPPAETRPES